MYFTLTTHRTGQTYREMTFDKFDEKIGLHFTGE